MSFHDNIGLQLAFAKVLAGGGGSGPSITVSPLSVTSNGTYSAAAGTAYSPVEVDVPNSYTASDEGKVVSNGALVPQTSSSITENGTVDTTLINSVEVNVSGGGGSDAEDEIIMRTISGAYVNSRVTEIGSYAFASCQGIKSVAFPIAKAIGNSAFLSCTALTTASFSVATLIGGSAFNGCINLTTLSFPMAKTIGTSAFLSCIALTTASFPDAMSIGNGAFNSCTSLTTVSLPNATSIGTGTFAYCYSLTTASFPVATSIGNYAFSRCRNLTSLYLTGSSIASLAASSAFASTPIGGYSLSAGQYGSIYVPSSLLASYQAATNWTYFSSRFVGI